MPTSEGVDTGEELPTFLEGSLKTGSDEALRGYTGATERGAKELWVGVQEWPDGSRYEGEFMNGLKQGEGVFTWGNGELYEGSFFKDYRHGNGTYIWPDGSRFIGKFYRNRKEGYGIQHFPDGTTFQGLYRADERFGPGVVTYPDGRQDVGLWHRQWLLRLCTVAPGAFTLRALPEYSAWDPPRRNPPPQPDSGSSPRSEGLDSPTLSPKKDLLILPHKIEAYSTDSDHLPLPHYLRRELDRHFFRGQDGDPDLDPTIFESLPLQLRMQAHIYRHRFEAETQGWGAPAVASGCRGPFGPRGPLELVSEQLIQDAQDGDLQGVYRTLRGGVVHPDVGDAMGHTALISATVNCHDDVIHLLLDSGADVNKLNGEGMSALAVCTVLYYPFDSLQETVAERTPQRQDCKMLSPLGGLLQGSIAGGVTKAGDELKPKTKQTDLANQSGCTDRSRPSPENPRSQTRSIQVLDGYIQLGSVSWPNTSNREVHSEEEVEFGDSAFDSARAQMSLPVRVSDDALQQTAEALSRSGPVRAPESRETVWKMALMKTAHRARWSTMNLLLSRGADPNASSVPMPVLFLAIKAWHVEAVRELLKSGARTDVPLPPERKGLYPLHIAAGLPGPEGPRITELLLHALADPDKRALDAQEVFELDKDTPEPQAGYSSKTTNYSRPSSQCYTPLSETPDEGGRTPLHVACQRDTEYDMAREVVSLLLSHKANTNLLWSGHSPLSLAIASGNDLAVDELLAWGADPNLPLTRRVGSALCAVANINYESRQRSRAKLVQSLSHRLLLPATMMMINLEKLIKAGANILMPVAYGDGRRSALGTAVDYAHYVFQQDGRIAHTPYHALSSREREAYNARRHLLALMGDLLRQAAVGVERQRLERELSLGIRSVSPSEKFLYIGAGASPPWARPSAGAIPEYLCQENVPSPEHRKPLFKYCYQCGRSAGVALVVCSRCREVFYCSKTCKMKAWSDRHREECIRISGKAKDRSCTPKKTRAPQSQPGDGPDRGRAETAGRKQTAPWIAAKDPQDSSELTENYSFN
ncbi:hypothetical protein AGOR_G00176420 [Albula goreensis]|uniref:MYND-type domain-containing protein n=1 Tax=Albula goreensis TaxID=1534307 RepID=A0A8T3CZS5_9TELE|nr:hypothetical protein AGOR_G00176420 [Albula goreensis]